MNPFGDDKLFDKFNWHKKAKKSDDVEDRESFENRMEWSKVKQSRLDRTFVNKIKEEEHSRLQKNKEEEYYNQWTERNENLLKSQLWTRSKIRLENNYPKPIDWFAYFICENDYIPDITDSMLNSKRPEKLIEVIFLLLNIF